MGVYNCNNIDLLYKSVHSIVNQDYSDWEFLICNDGSTNNTLKHLKIIEQQDSRIKILTYSENKGLNYALNYCLEYANGAYIARQDDDDTSKPDRFQKQINFLKENSEYDIVGSLAVTYNDIGEWGFYTLPEKPVIKDFLWNSPFIHPATIMKTSSLKKAGGYRISKETRRCEDYDLFMRMYSMGMKGYNLQENLYEYRMVVDPDKQYRPMKYRIDEAKVRFIGYRKMGILFCGLPFVIKPILIGLIPSRIFAAIRISQYK